MILNNNFNGFECVIEMNEKSWKYASDGKCADNYFFVKESISKFINNFLLLIVFK